MSKAGAGRNESSTDGVDVFDTSHLDGSLGKRSVRSGAATMVAQATKFISTMVTTAVLARILVPEDFGLFAIVGSVLVLVTMFQDAGLSMATVQREKIDHRQVSTLFWINSFAGLVLALLTVAISPVIGEVLADERLVGIMSAMAIPIFLSGISAQHGALLQRKMRFVAEQGIVISSQLVGAAAAIIAAYYGAGYWALVIKAIAAAVVVVIVRWSAVRWVPGLPRRRSGVRPMLSFGASLTLGRFFTELAQNVDNVMLGAVWGPSVLGFYSKAYGLLTLPIRQINAPVGMAALPALSRLQDNPVKFRQFYRQGIELVALVGMPLICFAAVKAEGIILIMLGDGWEESVKLFRALAPAAFIGTFNVSSTWLLVPLGRSRILLWSSVGMSFVTILGFVIGLRWGAMGVALSYSISSMLTIIPVLFIASRNSPVSLIDIAGSLYRPAFSAIVSGAVAYFIGPYMRSANVVVDTLLSLLVFAVLFVACYLVLPGGRAFFSEGVRMARKTFLAR